jgi:hypothetical protein
VVSSLGTLNVDLQEDTHRLKSESVPQRKTAATLWALLTAGAAYLFFFEPGRTGFFPGCPFRAITGLTCPGCGTTRALHQLLHGNLLAALELNPLLILLLPVLGCILVYYTWCAIKGKPMAQLVLPRGYAWAFYALVVVFWILRNTAAYPFPL